MSGFFGVSLNAPQPGVFLLPHSADGFSLTKLIGGVLGIRYLPYATPILHAGVFPATSSRKPFVIAGTVVGFRRHCVTLWEKRCLDATPSRDTV